MQRYVIWAASLAWLGLGLGGCSATGSGAGKIVPPVPPIDEPVYSLVADFSRADDRLFIDGSGGTADLPPGKPVTIRLPDLIRGRTYPGRWSMAEVTFTPTGAPVDVSWQLADITPGHPTARAQTTGPAGSTAYLLDLPPTADKLLVTNAGPVAASVRTLRLMDNRAVVIDRTGAMPFAVRRDGSRWTIKGRRYDLTLPALGPGALRPIEVNEIRAVFESVVAPAGDNLTTVYATGTVLEGSHVARGFERDASLVASVADPGQLTLLNDAGTLMPDPVTSGDGRNYLNRRGAWRVRAFGPRLRLRLAPGGAPILRPAMEIEGLTGRATPEVTIDGQRIDRLLRTGDVWLIEFPVKVVGPAVIEINQPQR